MTGGRDPWADPDTPTEPGAPYTGPPTTAPPGTAPPLHAWAPPGYGAPSRYGTPGYGAPAGYGAPGLPPSGHGAPGAPPYGHPAPGYGYPAPWPVAPRGPRRPGQVIASAVLAFVQAALVLIASLYVWFFASIVTVASTGAPGVLGAEGLATEGTVLAAVQVLSAVLLVTAGVMALNRRSRPTWLLLVAAHALQLVLAFYWWVRLAMLADDLPGGEADGLLLGFTLFFAAGPAVGLGLSLVRSSRRWFAAEQAAGPATA